MYRATEAGTENFTNAGLTDSVYSIVTFSEKVTKVESDGATARPKIVYKTSSSASETQYDIVSSGSTLASGDCKPNATGTVYSCMYTGTGLSGTNLFKSYVTSYTDIATNSGTAQSYSTNTGGVTFADNASVSLSFNPANNGRTKNNAANITITASGAIYADSSGTAFTDTGSNAIDDIITLKVTNVSGSDIDFDATISGTVITINPDNNLADGAVYVAISNGWYYGANPTKTQGTASNATFTVDTVDPTVNSIAYRSTEGGTDGLTNAGLTDSVYSIVTFSEAVTKVESDGGSARPDIVYKTSSSASETQYDIVAAGSTLASGDCKPNNAGTVYTCMYTGSSLSGSNLFKSYATVYTDLATNSGTAQSYSTNADGVTLADNAAVTFTYDPADDGHSNDDSANITITASADIYNDSSGTAFTDTGSDAIDNIITLKVTNASGTDIDFDATISGNVITINPDNDLAEGAVYVALSNSWYYGANPTKTQGAASNATFTVDTTDPTISSIAYRATEAGTDGFANAGLTDSVYSVVTFSEEVKKVEANDGTARPEIVYRTDSGATETQYDIVAAGSTLASGDCKPNSTGTKYTCMYTGSSLNGTNLFKSYVTNYEDLATNSGSAQTYGTNAGGVTIANNVAPTLSFDPAASEYTNDNTTNITITASSPLYKTSTGTAFTDSGGNAIDDIITLKVTNASGTDIAFDATISGNVITINPSSNLADGDVYVALSNGWYYGANPTKSQGTATNATFTVDTSIPTVSSIAYRLNESDTDALTNAGLTDSFYSVVTFSEQVTKVESDGATARPKIVYKTSSSATEYQYDIVAAGSTLASGDCKPNSAGTVYTCKYTASLASGTHLFKSYVTAFTNLASSAGSAQNYSTNAGGVTLANNVKPSITYSPADDGHSNADSGNITITFGSAIYTNSTGTAFTDTTIDDIITLKEDDNSGTAIANDVTISGNVVTINPTNDLAEGDVYVALSNGWYYGANPTKTQGTAENITFTVDTTDPTISSIAYRATEAGTENFTNAGLTDSFYSIVSFSEELTKVESDGGTARPKIVYKTNSSASEEQYDIVAAGSTLASGDCKPNSTGTVYSCMYTGSSLSGTNLFKTYITNYTDLATNAGDAQTYSTNAGGVTISNNVKPSILYNPVDSGFTNTNTTNITIIFNSAIYADSTGTAFTNTTIDDIITLKVTNSGGTDIDFGATIAGNTITIDPDNNLADGVVYVGLSNGWYYGANPTKTQGTAENITFTVDTAAPTLTISAVSGGYVNASEDDSGVTISGSTTGADSGSDVDLTFTNGSNTVSINDITVSSNAWTTTLTLAQLTTLTEGTISISGTVDDSAGNDSTAATQSFVYDITAPSITATVGGTLTARTVKGVDTDTPDTETSWKYKVIDNGTTCGSAAMSGASAYTENTDQSVGVSAHNKKVCFSSTDTAGNVGYGATSQLSIAGNAPTRTWVPPTGGYLTSLDGNVTLSFGSDVYSNNTCTTELTNTTADNAVTLGTTSGGNDVATTVTYTAASNLITIDPDSDLTDATTYYAGLTNAWYYQNGACAPGSAESISFTTDATAPTVSSVAYRYTEAGSDGFANAGLSDSFFSVVSFSEEVTKVESDGATARPKIVYKTSSTATEVQYDIVAAGSTLASGDCKPNSAGTKYTCKYTSTLSSGSHLFKSYVTSLH